jgi:hypothetical protein
MGTDLLQLFRFVAYWNSIEVLGSWYYDKIYEKMGREEKQKRIMKIIGKNISEANCALRGFVR